MLIKTITAQEIGTIVARLALHNEGFLQSLLQEAATAEDALLPDDMGRLETWALFIRAVRSSLDAAAKPTGTH